MLVLAPVLRKDDYLKKEEERKRKEEEDKKRKEEEERKKKEEEERKKKEEEERKKKAEEEKKKEKEEKPVEKKEEKKEEKKDDQKKDEAAKEDKSIFPKMKCTFVDFLLKPIEESVDKRLGNSIDPFTGYSSQICQLLNKNTKLCLPKIKTKVLGIFLMVQLSLHFFKSTWTDGQKKSHLNKSSDLLKTTTMFLNFSSALFL